jgi:AraC-like DNA-binding protein
MNVHILTSIIFSVGIAQGLFLLFMLLRHKNRTTHAVVMAAWIAFFLINLIIQSFAHTGIISCTNFSVVLTTFFPFLFSPFLFLACKTAASPSYTLRWTVILHAIPFFAALLARTVIVVCIPEKTVQQFFLLPLLNVPLFIGAVIYHVVCFKLAFRYTTSAKEYLSAPARSYSSWIGTLVVLSCCIWLTALLMICVHKYSITVLSLLYTIVVYVVSTKIVVQPELFAREQQLQHTLTETHASDGISTATAERLRIYMEKSRAYLNPDITIADISTGTDIPIYTVSKTLNTLLGVSFYQFINEYRVREAQKLLSDKSKNGTTVLDIGFSSGFNSKSAFNDVFRRSTGMTPSEFKKKNVLSAVSE